MIRILSAKCFHHQILFGPSWSCMCSRGRLLGPRSLRLTLRQREMLYHCFGARKMEITLPSLLFLQASDIAPIIISASSPLNSFRSARGLHPVLLILPGPLLRMLLFRIAPPVVRRAVCVIHSVSCPQLWSFLAWLWASGTGFLQQSLGSHSGVMICKETS